MCDWCFDRIFFLAWLVLPLACIPFEGDELTYVCSSSRDCTEGFVCFSGRVDELPVCVSEQNEQECAPGFADCDDDPSLCEAQTTSSREHCGACGNACERDALCEDGRCLVPCDATRCGDACVILTSSPEHCGACDRACRGDEICQSGECVCPGTSRLCAGVCVDTRFDAAHCGACDRPCFENQLCNTNACVCSDGFGDCTEAVPGCETALNSVATCGSCDNDCNALFPDPLYADVVCDEGRCDITCWEGFGDCDGDPTNGCEEDLRRTNRHCSLCGNVCSQLGQGCHNATCITSRKVIGFSAGESFQCVWNAATPISTRLKSVRCRGDNEYAQLGTGSTDPAYASDEVNVVSPGLRNDRVLEVAAGQALACAVTEVGTVYCWGRDAGSGIFGPDKTNDRGAVAPELIGGLPHITHIAVGDIHACAIELGGSVICWGKDVLGRLGSEQPSTEGAWVRVRNIDDALDIRAGRAHTCVLTRKGRVLCWGVNGLQQLGIGDKRTSSSLPIEPSFPDNLRAIRIESHSQADHTCAVLVTANDSEAEEGEVWCWGKNNLGQLANDNQGKARTPSRVGALSDVSELAVGANHACAIRNSHGDIRCWGQGAFGQLGHGAFPNAQSQPVTVEPVVVNEKTLTPRLLGAGDAFTCAFYEDSVAMHCWGRNSHGQLGSSSTLGENVATPAAASL